MSEIPDAIVDAAIVAYWNAIPCHIPWEQYIRTHAYPEQVLASQRQYMRAALSAATATAKVVVSNQLTAAGTEESKAILGVVRAIWGEKAP